MRKLQFKKNVDDEEQNESIILKAAYYLTILFIILGYFGGILIYAYTEYIFFTNYKAWFAIIMLCFPVINTLILWFDYIGELGFWNILTVSMIIYGVIMLLGYVLLPMLMAKFSKD